MTRTKSIVGALALCALSICAIAAANASAAELTAVTCEQVTAGTGVYTTENCVTPEAAGGNFKTKEIPLNTKTEVTGTSTEEEPALRATIGGAAVTVKCEVGHLVNSFITNKEPTPTKHTIEFTGESTYTGCKAVLKANEARWCGIEEIPTGKPGAPGVTGMITTKKLKGTTTGNNHQIIIEPHEGELFAEFGIESKTEGGSECPFNTTITVQVTGKVEGEANTTNHAHLTFTEANNGLALKANGGAAKYLDTVGGRMAGVGGAVVGAQTFT